MRVYDFKEVEPWSGVSKVRWLDWKWQMRQALKNQEDFEKHFELTKDEKLGFQGLDKIFQVRTTPYYACLADSKNPSCPIRQMIIPKSRELFSGQQQMPDPLGENKKKNRPCERLIHRYTDRALLLVTDFCGIYCRYCTRKHFTASNQALISTKQMDKVLMYLKSHPEIKEVIFSGGDPLTVSNTKLTWIMERIHSVKTVEFIRMGSRMPAVCPMRLDDELLEIFKEFKPVYLMTHFNHPDELTGDSARILEKLADSGVPMLNQMVLLNGINNHPALVYALSRRLLYLRVKPYYMFQADPSMGTDHLRTSIDESLEIQRQLWGHSSGLSMPTYIVDIPDGGGKVSLTPDFQVQISGRVRHFKGWDGIRSEYISPRKSQKKTPILPKKYQIPWLHEEQ